MSERYPGYDVLAKWNTPSFNAQTRGAIEQRLHHIPQRRFFSSEEWALLDAIVARLVPQPDRAEPVPIVPWIDASLADGTGEGFRHDSMPPTGEAWRRGLAGIAHEARRRYACDFSALGAKEQDATLAAVQNGEVDEPGWNRLPARLFFSHLLLKTAVGIYYAHPAAWNEIGFGGPASPRGYVRIGPNKRDPWEAKETTDG